MKSLPKTSAGKTSGLATTYNILKTTMNIIKLYCIILFIITVIMYITNHYNTCLKTFQSIVFQ